jgi:hypothetical protein
MKKLQFFSHRPPSQTTLLNDPWPAALQVRKYRKTFEWPPYRVSNHLASPTKAKAEAGLEA